jgi:hypothetical protein
LQKNFLQKLFLISFRYCKQFFQDFSKCQKPLWFLITQNFLRKFCCFKSEIFKYEVAHIIYHKNLIDEKKNQDYDVKKEARQVLQIIGG